MSYIEAPVFEPTWAEFKSPLSYIESIRPHAEYTAGICRIRPPSRWQPSFTLDVNTFKFSTNVQHIGHGTWENQQRSSSIEYNLKDYGKMADDFEREFFQCPLHSVSESVVQDVFWNIISGEDDVGVDVQSATLTDGVSGFTLTSRLLEDEEYVNSGWNLLNLAKNNILARIPSSPFMRTKSDVEMCFSSAPFRVEDYWTYYVSYMHWGDTKAWYSTLPAEFEAANGLINSSKVEDSMQEGRNLNIFGVENETQPYQKRQPLRVVDASGELVVLTPSQLVKSGVTVVRTVQSAGEFVIVFPQAFHAHISHGFNFSESVCIAPPSWLGMGARFSAEHRLAAVPCLFSYEELVCRLLDVADSMNVESITELYAVAHGILGEEMKARMKLIGSRDIEETEKITSKKEQGGIKEEVEETTGGETVCTHVGVSLNEYETGLNNLQDHKHSSEMIYACEMTLREEQKLQIVSSEKDLVQATGYNFEREAFELLTRDERMCSVCRTTCFLSAITCTCTDRIVCLDHSASLCECSPTNKTLRYRHTLCELSNLVGSLQKRVASYRDWDARVHSALDDASQRMPVTTLKKLKRWAMKSGYESCALYARLQECLRTCCRYACVARQLLEHVSTAACNTRSCDVIEITDETESRLTLDELAAFVEQLRILQCSLPEADQLAEIVTTASDVRNEALRSLAAEFPSPLSAGHIESLLSAMAATSGSTISSDIRHIADIIRKAEQLPVILSELLLLRELADQLRWMNDVERCMKLDGGSQLTIDILRRLIDRGAQLAPQPSCQRALAELQRLLADCQNVEDRARQMQQTKHPLCDLQALLDEAEAMPVYLPAVHALRRAVRAAEDWIDKVDRLLSSDQATPPYLGVLEKYLSHAQSLPVQLEQLYVVDEQVDAARAWLDRASKAFLLKNSSYSLYEVLSPRVEIELAQSQAKHRKQRPGDPNSVHSKSISRPSETEDLPDPTEIANNFKSAELKEINAMLAVREINTHKSNTYLGLNGARASGGSPSTVKYCLCARAKTPDMIQCQLCKDWFHMSCVTIPKSAISGATQQQLQSHKKVSGGGYKTQPDFKFLCQFCVRSRRPKLEIILSLVLSLQKLPVRIAEGEALQSMAEHAMVWQERARRMLSTDELVRALAKLTTLSQQRTERAAFDKGNRIINSELLKAASNGARHSDMNPYGGNQHPYTYKDGSVNVSMYSVPDPYRDPYRSGCSSAGYDVPVSHSLQFQGSSSASAALLQAARGLVHLSQTPPSAYESAFHRSALGHDSVPAASTSFNMTPIEHAYSTVSKHAAYHHHQSSTYRPPPSPEPLMQASMPMPLLELSTETFDALDRLMMEGDLIEVSLDETKRIWTILKSCQSGNLDSIQQLTGVSSVPDSVANNSGMRAIKHRKKRKQEMAQRWDTVWNDERFDERKPVKSSVATAAKVKAVKFVSKTKMGEIQKRKRMMKVALSTGSGATKKVKHPKQQERSSFNNKATSSDDDCAAEKCVRPLGNEVNWVQCDRCEKWFHYACVGLSVREFNPDDDYVCQRCGCN